MLRGCALLENREVCRYPNSGSIAMGVGQHRQVVKQSQNSSAVAKLSRKQQQSLPQLLQRDISILLPGENSTNQLGAITGRPDLGKQTNKQQEIAPGNTHKCFFFLNLSCGFCNTGANFFPSYIVTVLHGYGLLVIAKKKEKKKGFTHAHAHI